MAQNTERSIETANAYAAGNIGNLDEAWTRRLVASVVDTESSGGDLRADNGFGYYGRYQGGAGWLVDAGLVNREKYDAALQASGFRSDWDWGVNGGAQRFLGDASNWNNGHSLEGYLGSAALQDQAFLTNSNATYQQAVRNGVLSADSEPNVVAGFLKARHLGGYDNAVDAAQGRGTVADANGTTTGKYYDDIARNNDGFDRHFVPDFVRRETNVTIDPMSDGVLKHGERGDAVRALQEALNTAGIRDAAGQPLPTTGYFGDMTEAAVRRYQEQQGLEVDGKAGNNTLTALGLKQEQPAPAPPTVPQPPVDVPQTPPTVPQPPADVPQTPPTVPQPPADVPQTPPTVPQPPADVPQTPPSVPQPPADVPQTPPSVPQPPVDVPQTDRPLISNPNHPDNRLYQQAVSNLEQLGPSGGFTSREALEGAAAAVAADAKATGLQSIDHISRTSAPGGQNFLVAVQGDPTSPAAKNSYIDYNQAVNQTVAQSTGMVDAQRVAAQAPAQTEPQQQEPNRIAAGGR